MRRVIFEASALDSFVEWSLTDKKTYKRLVRLIEESRRTPFEGVGKPEPLKHDLQGLWSRRITDEDCLIYTVSDDAITIFSCKGHYNL